MGATIEKCMVFPAPPSSRAAELRDSATSSNIIWDPTPGVLPGGGVERPFLWLPMPGTLMTLVHFHGNAEDLSLVEPWLQELHEMLGVNVLAVEYPGYGLLQDPDRVEDWGTTTIEGIDNAAIHALHYVILTQHIPCDQVLLHGRSLGTGAALRLARRARDEFGWNVGGVVLQSPYLSMQQVAVDHVGVIGSYLVQPYYDNLETLRELCHCRDMPSTDVNASVRTLACWEVNDKDATERSCMATTHHMPPLLILHGERDDIIAPYHGHVLHEEAVRLGHPAVEACFPCQATHQNWDTFVDIVLPISRFILKYVPGRSTGWPPQCASKVPSSSVLEGDFHRGFLEVFGTVLSLSESILVDRKESCLQPL